MLSKIANTFALVAALAATATGHTEVESVTIGGKTYQGFRQPSRDYHESDAPKKSPAWWTNQGWNHGPIMGNQINHPNIIAHKDAKPSPFVAEAAAGSDVTFKWYHKWDGHTCKNTAYGGSEEDGWDCSHHGFTATYLAPFSGEPSEIVKEDLKFFKIHESGIIGYPKGTRFATSNADGAKGASGYWGTDAIFYNQNNDQSQTVTLPSDIPSGNYVLATIVSSVHNRANGFDELQFWPQAFNIKVTGGKKDAKVPAGTRGTELYSKNDKLLNWDIYWHGEGELERSVPGGQLYNAKALKPRAHAKDFSV